MPPGTPQNQKSTGHADFGPTSTYRGRRSFAPGGTLGAFGDAAGDTADGRKSCARMSVMPSSHRAAALMTGAPLPVSFSEHQATKAENNRLRQQLEQANEKLDDERNLRQKKEDESIAFSRKLADATQRLTKTQRAAGRAERRQKRDEDEKAKGEEQMKYTIDELQEQMKGIADDKELQNAQLAELSKRVADKERTVVAMKNELASFQSDNDELKQANEGLETKLHSAVTELSDTSAKLDQAEGNNSSLRATMQDYRAEGDAHLKEMNDRITNLTLELEDKTDENTELHTQLEEVTKAKASLQSDLTVSETHHTDAASSLEKVNRTYVDLVAEHSKLQAKWEIAEAKMEELESDIADKGNHLGQKTDAVAKLKEEVCSRAPPPWLLNVIHCYNITNLFKEPSLLVWAFLVHTRCKPRNGCRTAWLGGPSHTLNERALYFKSIFSSQITLKLPQVTTLKQTVNEVSSQIRMRDDDIRELQSQKEALETQLEDQIKDNTVLAGKLEGERSRDHQARKDNVAETTKLLKEAEEAKEATREQKRRVTSLEKQVKKLKAEVEDASRENDNAVKESDELEEKVADLDYKVKIEMHNAKRQTLIAETLRKKLEQKETDIKSLRKSKKTLIDTANERLDKMNAETKKLEGIANQYRYTFFPFLLSFLSTEIMDLS